jgi:5-oxoprolinase (ATP-hydrolysing)
MNPSPNTDRAGRLQRRWQFWIDRGGTFTDLVARRPDGEVVTAKLLSENPEQYEDAATEGIRRLLDLSIGRSHSRWTKSSTCAWAPRWPPMPCSNDAASRLCWSPRGFRDALFIGHQSRPKIFALDIRRPEQLYEEWWRSTSALAPTVRCCKHPIPSGCEQLASRLRQRHPRPGRDLCSRLPPARHEQLIGKIALEIGFEQVSLSHQVSPLIRFIGRGDTTVVDAYLSPILRRYADRVAADWARCTLQFMKSDGGLTDAQQPSPARTPSSPARPAASSAAPAPPPWPASNA